MKKVILLLITALVIFTLSACGNDNTNSNSTDIKTDNNSSVIKTGNKNSEKITSQSDTVVVPNVVGMNKNEAIKKLEDAGLKAKPTENSFYDNNKKVDEVDSQSVEEGVVVLRNKEVAFGYNSPKLRWDYLNFDDLQKVRFIGFSGASNITTLTIPDTIKGKPVYVRGIFFLKENFQNLKTIYVSKNIEFFDFEECVAELKIKNVELIRK